MTADIATRINRSRSRPRRARATAELPEGASNGEGERPLGPIDQFLADKWTQVAEGLAITETSLADVKRETKLRVKSRSFISEKFARSREAERIKPSAYGLSAGYGVVQWQGRQNRAHRVVCERVHGIAPFRHEATHQCGVRACVNKRHLRWNTRGGNVADTVASGKHAHGEINGKLTREIVKEIRRSRGLVLQRDLAEKFGVSKGTIGDIQRRRSVRTGSGRDARRVFRLLPRSMSVAPPDKKISIIAPITRLFPF